MQLLQRAYQILGTELIPDETIDNISNRINVISWLCLYGDGDCQQKMTDILSAQGTVEPDLQSSVYCGGMRNGTLNNWEYLFQKYLSNSTEDLEKSRIVTALGCSLNVEILET